MPAQAARSPPQRTNQCPAGFTLVELLVTVTRAASLATLAVPGFRNLAINYRIAAQSAGLAMDFTFARSEAVRRGATAVVCPTDAAATVCVGSS